MLDTRTAFRERSLSLAGRFRLVESAAVLRFFFALTGLKNQAPAVSKTLQREGAFPSACELNCVVSDMGAFLDSCFGGQNGLETG